MKFQELKNLKKCNKNIFGAKAYNLWLLYRNNIFIPRTFLLPAAEVDKITYKWEQKNKKLLEKYEKADIPDKIEMHNIIEKNFINSKYIDENIKPLINELKTLLVLMKPIVIRSSSTIEDSPNYSGAGNFYTALNITTTKMAILSFKKCIASKYTYLTTNKKQIKLGVIVQEYIKFKYSGILFNQNPTSKKINSLVEIVRGNPDKLVSGKISGVIYQFYPEKYKLEKINHRKELIPSCEIKKFITASINFENSMKSKKPYEFEWGYKNNKFIYLQARPITKVILDKKKSNNLNGYIANSDNPISPFGFSVIEKSNKIIRIIGKLFYKYVIRVNYNGFQYSKMIKNKNFNVIKNFFVMCISILAYSGFKLLNLINSFLLKYFSRNEVVSNKVIKLIVLETVLSRILLDVLWMTVEQYLKRIKNFLKYLDFDKNEIKKFLSDIKPYSDEIEKFNLEFKKLLKGKIKFDKFILQYPYIFERRNDIHDVCQWQTFFENKNKLIQRLNYLKKLKQIKNKNTKVSNNIKLDINIFKRVKLNYLILLYKYSLVVKNNRDIYHLRTLALLRLVLFKSKFQNNINGLFFLNIKELFKMVDKSSEDMRNSIDKLKNNDIIYLNTKNLTVRYKYNENRS